MNLSETDLARLSRVDVRITKPHEVDRTVARAREGRTGRAHARDNDGFVKAFNASGELVGATSFVEVNEEAVETTNIIAYLQGDGVALAMIVNLVQQYEGRIVRESNGINTEDGDALLAAVRRKGIEYHRPSCHGGQTCSCFTLDT